MQSEKTPLTKTYLYDFFSKVLKGLSCPVTNENLEFLYAWAAAESRAKNVVHGNNPLNTTFRLSQDKNRTNFNKNAGYPVQNYSTFEYGVSATIATLKLSYYRDLVKYLKANEPEGIAMDEKALNALKVWGTTNFANKISKIGSDLLPLILIFLALSFLVYLVI
jgi:hypothetical protein